MQNLQVLVVTSEKGGTVIDVLGTSSPGFELNQLTDRLFLQPSVPEPPSFFVTTGTVARWQRRRRYRWGRHCLTFIERAVGPRPGHARETGERADGPVACERAEPKGKMRGKCVVVDVHTRAKRSKKGPKGTVVVAR